MSKMYLSFLLGCVQRDFGAFDFVDDHLVFQGPIGQEVDFGIEKGFQGVQKGKEIVRKIQRIQIVLEFDHKIKIAGTWNKGIGGS